MRAEFFSHTNLMNRYSEALDSCNWALLGSLFTADAVFAARMIGERGAPDVDIIELHGRDAIVGKIAAMIESLASTHHMMGNQEVTVLPDSKTASASCYFRAYHAGKGERAHLFEESLGRFDFQTRLTDSGWQIARMDENIFIMLGTPDAFGVGPD